MFVTTLQAPEALLTEEDRAKAQGFVTDQRS